MQCSLTLRVCLILRIVMAKSHYLTLTMYADDVYKH